jgi:hypothetical protein
MAKKKFPYKGWVLTPSFEPKEKTFVYQYGYYDYHVSGDEKYRIDMIFKDKTSAIAWGHKELEKQKAALDKKLANLENRRKSLDKAQD